MATQRYSNLRNTVVSKLLKQDKPAWQYGVYTKLVFRQTTKVVNYFGVTQLIAFCDAISVLLVHFIDRFTHYFDLNKQFDS